MITQIRQLLAAPVFEDEDKTRVAGLLNIVLLTALSLSVVFMIVTPIISPNPIFSWVATGTLMLPQLGALFLMHRGRVQPASALYSFMLWLIVTLSAVFAGGVRSASFSIYTLIILIAGLLLGWRAGVAFIGLSVVAGLGMLYAESKGILPSPLIANTSVSVWTAQTAGFITAAALLYLATHSIVSGLERARLNERALAESYRELETEIAERVRAEAALRESEARYRSLFEDSPISLWEEDFSEVKKYIDDLRSAGVSDFREYFEEHPEAVARCAGMVKVLDINQATLELFKGRGKEEIHKGLGAVFGEETFDVFREELITLAEGRTRFESEAILQTLTGDKMHTALSLAVASGYEETWSKVFVSIIDITERRQAETEQERLLTTLKHRSTQLQTAAQVSKSASTILDPEELMNQAVNLIRERFDFYYVGLFLVEEVGEYALLRAGTGEAGQRMLAAGHRLAVGGKSMIGWSVANARARIALDVGKEAVRFDNPYLPETRSEMALPLISRGQCIGGLTVQSTEEAAFSEEDIAVLQAMADQLAIAIENARLYDAARREIARRRRAEEEIRKLNVELEQRVIERTAELTAVNKELEAFTYSVSHDLRAPLRSIDGFSQALLEDYAEVLDADGQDYLQRVRAASQRMGQLINDLLKLSRVTRREMHYAKVDLSALAGEITAELRETQPERQVEFVIVEGLVANGDARLLRLVLENLLGNAWKFTSKHPRARIEFGVTQIEGKTTYFVRDDGAGFDMAYTDKLFGAFQRLHAATEYEGTGVGLATVQRIIHRHGGQVWAEAEIDKGATFYFAL